MQGFSREPGTHGPLEEEIPTAGKRKVGRWGAVIAVGGFLFGYDTGVVSGALLYIRRDFDLNSFQQGAVVSVMLIGAMFGALGAGRVADRIGRKKTLALEGVVFIFGTAIAVAATGFGMLVAGRVVLGLAVGAASATVPIYLSEISPSQIRGRVLSANQLMITVGILASYLVDLAFAGSGNWRAMIGAGFVPSVFLCLGTLFLVPESPLWLMRNGEKEKARKVIAMVSDEEHADRLLERFRQYQEQQKRSGGGEGGSQQSQRQGWRVLLTARARPALAVGLVLAAVQQFGGINTIIYYSPTIIEQTGLNASNSIFYSVFIGAINLLMTLVALRLIDRVGRRRLLIISLAGMLVTLALLGLSFVADWNSELSLVFMVLYIAVYAGGLGSVFWVLVGEIFPPSARAPGSSASTTVNWLSNFVVGQAFLPVADALGQGETFWIFAVICAVGLVFVGRFVPETQGRDFAEVDASLQARFGHKPSFGKGNGNGNTGSGGGTGNGSGSGTGGGGKAEGSGNGRSGGSGRGGEGGDGEGGDGGHGPVTRD
ncbi:sugar porter family MFS transporter [Streptomyces iconiensis]|uniref:Sugar porter family MFS transporter n=1 Tax=Streptomyces iconiensis TaxID=1384038 RepID=A0ABT6ZQH7_9ACTN|nr:sugar porter family MFS transporter [Streptomyces iconiensis]MDJ1131303.1 sugar porter family MFS transporter [Streptomyces iconiensis]